MKTKPHRPQATSWKEEFAEKFTYASFTWNGDAFTGVKFAKQTRNRVKAFIRTAIQAEKMSVANQIFEAVERANREFMEPCEPDCDPVRHARHEGSWDHYWKMQGKLAALRKAWGGDVE